MAKYGKDDFHGDDDVGKDEDEFEFGEDDLFKVLSYMKNCSEMLMNCDTEELCEHYRRLYPPVDGLFLFSESRMNHLNTEMINITLQELVKRDLVEMSWSDTKNDFVFSLKEDTSGI